MSVNSAATQVDMCSSCEIAATCVYRAMYRYNGRRCDLYDGPETVANETHAAFDDRSTKGLCSNCENRRTCLLPKADGGVWHCEEYR